MQLHRRLIVIYKMKSTEKIHKIHKKRKAAFESDAFSLLPLYFERERWPVCSYRHCQALKTVSVILYYYFIKHNKVVQIYETVSMLMRKTFRWHAVIHVRTYGHPISNLADFEKKR